MSENAARESLTPEYFEDVYNANDDPWDFETSGYEAAKYAATLEALPRFAYDSAFEIGCSIGVLTEKLAARCERLFAIDVNEKALAQAQQRCANLPQVHLQKMQIPDEFPAEKFDLIIVSEVGYYLSVEDWKTAQEKILTHLNPNGNVVLVHWTHFVHDYPQTGDEVHESFTATADGRLTHLKTSRTADYRLDVWEKKRSGE